MIAAPTDSKRIATLTALLALRGYQLDPLDTGGFIVSRWNLSRPLADLQAVEAFAEQAGVQT